MKLLVSIHDVTPAHAEAVHRLWEYCAALGIRPALFVVPNWHGRWPIEDYRFFVDWLRDCSGHGHGAEIFLHGERHDEHGSRRRLADELRAFGRTNGEAEFLTLGYDEARDRINRGVRRLERLRLDPVGFVAPAWLSSPACRTALSESGLGISEDDAGVVLHRRGTRLDSPVVRWSTRTPWRQSAGAVAARFARLVYARRTLVRIALHPSDVAHPKTWRSVRDTLDHCLASRQPWRYGML
jgi:uncharacterized protein